MNSRRCSLTKNGNLSSLDEGLLILDLLKVEEKITKLEIERLRIKTILNLRPGSTMEHDYTDKTRAALV